ncbi:hypothetical protein VTN96DRAFT_8699 [Rasamsonia emersonii]
MANCLPRQVPASITPSPVSGLARSMDLDEGAFLPIAYTNDHYFSTKIEYGAVCTYQGSRLREQAHDAWPSPSLSLTITVALTIGSNVDGQSSSGGPLVIPE